MPESTVHPVGAVHCRRWLLGVPVGLWNIIHLVDSVLVVGGLGLLPVGLDLLHLGWL